MGKDQARPPRFAILLLKWFCRSAYHPDIEGDLLELFDLNAAQKGSAKARWLFVKEVLFLFRRGLIRSLTNTQKLNTMDMIKHTVLFSIRSFKRYKSSFFINLIGLSSGLACAFLIYLWISDELRVDQFHDNKSLLYQVLTNEPSPAGIATGEATPHLLADALAEEVPEIESSISFSPTPNDLIFSIEDLKLKAQGHFAGADFFKMFSFPLLQGNKNDVLSDKNHIAISESLALKIFNTTEGLMGKTLNWKIQSFSSTGIINGIFKDPTPQSTHQFDYIIHFEQFEDLVKTFVGGLTWETSQPFTYVQIAAGTTAGQVNDKISDFIQQKTGKDRPDLFLRPFADKYLYGNYKNGVQAGGRIEYVRIFSIIAIFILVVACINFMNLSTARASRRLKEVGVKKAIGAQRHSLIFQFIGESMILSFLSMMVAIALILVALPYFNTITGKQLLLEWDTNLMFTALAITLITGLTSGSYPAFLLSGMRPVEILKGKLRNTKKASLARKGLVTFQFIVSVLLIVSVTVIYKQVDFIQSKNLGYNKTQLVSFPKEGKTAENLDLFLEQAAQLPGIRNISAISNNMTQSGNTIGAIDWEGKSPEIQVVFQFIALDFEMLETLETEIFLGRSFSKAYGSDDSKVIINEAAMKTMDMADPIGKTVSLAGQDRQIVGVTRDFHFESLHTKVQPAVMIILPQWTNVLMARLEGDDTHEALNRLSSFYEDFNEGLPLELSFVDDQYQSLYQAELQISTLSRYFAGFAILISCLGLLGLVAFTAERRKKEIGIRKILGSKAGSIALMLSKEFTLTVLTALIIALPISYWVTSDWLSGFEYRIRLEWWFFIVSGFITIAITWLTVGVQTIRASLSNPVASLRSD